MVNHILRQQRLKASLDFLYRWDEWFSRLTFTLRRDVHFSCTVEGMLQQVRNQAMRRSLHIRTTVEGEAIVVVVLENAKNA